MKNVLLGMVFLTAIAYSDEIPTTSVLLNKLAENLDGFKSVVITSETRTRGSKTPDMAKLGGTAITQTVFRTDGNRTRSCKEIWGDVPGQELEQKDAIHKSGLWDGENYYQYDYAKHIPDTPIPNGRVHLTPKSKIKKFDNGVAITTREIIGSACGFILGYFPRDDNRIDHILQTCSDVKRKDQKIQIGDSLCFVLEADTYTGAYKVYLDPDRNYSIVRIENIKTAGDKAFSYGYDLRGQDKVDFTYEAKEFKNIDGQWVAIKSDQILKRTMQDGVFSFASKTVVDIQDIQLNPDHDAMHSFVPDDIKNGAYVTITGDSKNIYTWKDGQPVKD